MSFTYFYRVKNFSLYVMATLYLLAGINHFWHPSFYLNIMPPWLGAQETLVYLSGICEMIFALLLLPIQTRRFASWGIILLLIAVFPANIQMMLNYFHENNPQLWLAILRLPVQFLLIWWAYSFTKK
jgi:uncharacterized membrane protein